jgi:hypothetical protein
VDSAWEQKKPKVRKMLEDGDESPASSARFVWRFLLSKTHYPKKTPSPTRPSFKHNFIFGNYKN